MGFKVKNILLTAIPVVISGLVAAYQTFNNQKEAKRINNMEATINDLVAFTKMDES